MRESLLNEDITIENLAVNSTVFGAIKSIEDHGYVVDFGINEVTGFFA